MTLKESGDALAPTGNVSLLLGSHATQWREQQKQERESDDKLRCYFH